MFEQNYITYLPGLGKYCMVRKYMTHDFASIPSFVRGITSADGILAYGAPVHDFGYRFQGLFLADKKGEQFVFMFLARKELDKIFTNRNDAATGLKRINKIAYKVLRWFGKYNYGQVDVRTVNWKAPF